MKKIITIAFVLVLVLSACTSSDKELEGDTLTYETDKGEITYKAEPKIYADYYVGQLLYLDANLVAADMTYPVDIWSNIAEERGVENIGEDMESIAVTEPDLIITIHEDFYDQYSDIAPTIYIPYGKYNQEDIVEQLGIITGTEEAASTWITSFNNEIAELKAEINDPEKTVGIVDAWGDGIYMYGANYGRGGYIIYTKLELQGTKEAEEDYIHKDESYATVDGETLTKYAGDILFITDDGEANVESIESLPTYNDLDAVKNDQVFKLDREIFLYDDPYSLDAQVEILKELYSSDEL